MPELRIFSSGAAVDCTVEPGRDLLGQLIPLGLSLNYSCRRGDCGQCLAVLESGVVLPQDAARPCVTAEGIYLCNTVAASDLVVRLPYCPETAGIRRMRSPCKIHQLARLSADVIELSLRLPPSTDFRFVPGQYVRLTNREQVSRSYSLAQPPARDKLLRLHVRRIPGGLFSDYLFARAGIGDLLQLEGPMGGLVLSRERQVGKTIFLATGTGLAPIYAILSGLDPEQAARCGRLFLYWGNRTRADAYWHDHIASVAQALNLRYTSVVSRGRDGAMPGAVVGHVQDAMADEHASLHNAQVLACGKPEMVNAARRTARALGLLTTHFAADPFTAS